MSNEEYLQLKQVELDKLWDKIESLKYVDEFAAQILYEKYKAMAYDIHKQVPETN